MVFKTQSSQIIWSDRAKHWNHTLFWNHARKYCLKRCVCHWKCKDSFAYLKQQTVEPKSFAQQFVAIWQAVTQAEYRSRHWILPPHSGCNQRSLQPASVSSLLLTRYVTRVCIPRTKVFHLSCQTWTPVRLSTHWNIQDYSGNCSGRPKDQLKLKDLLKEVTLCCPFFWHLLQNIRRDLIDSWSDDAVWKVRTVWRCVSPCSITRVIHESLHSHSVSTTQNVFICVKGQQQTVLLGCGWTKTDCNLLIAAVSLR